MTNDQRVMENQAGAALSGRDSLGLAEFPGRCPGLTSHCAFGAIDWSPSLSSQPRPPMRTDVNCAARGTIASAQTKPGEWALVAQPEGL
jgi:hypothetical protein